MPKVDLTQFNRQMARANKAFNTLPDYALRTMRAYTPYRTGNARRNTRLQGQALWQITHMHRDWKTITVRKLWAKASSLQRRLQYNEKLIVE